MSIIIMLSKPLKKPISVLVVLHDGSGNALMLERADYSGFWQSITGSLEHNETPFIAALREVAEETSIILRPEQLNDWHKYTEFEIYPHWRHRYPANITHNREHWFSAKIPYNSNLILSEHTAAQWLPIPEAITLAFSPSNKQALHYLLTHNHLST